MSQEIIQKLETHIPVQAHNVNVNEFCVNKNGEIMSLKALLKKNPYLQQSVEYLNDYITENMKEIVTVFD